MFKYSFQLNIHFIILLQEQPTLNSGVLSYIMYSMFSPEDGATSSKSSSSCAMLPVDVALGQFQEQMQHFQDVSRHIWMHASSYGDNSMDTRWVARKLIWYREIDVSGTGNDV